MHDTDEDLGKEIGNTLLDIVRRADAELITLTQDQLESRWLFRHEPHKTIAWSIYEFSTCLEMYKRSCRRWEEHNNGNSCVVERVRDKYLLPKIKQFEEQLRARMATIGAL